MPDNRQPDNWLQYSGIGIQMAATIIVCWWFGEKLDENDIKRYQDIYKRI